MGIQKALGTLALAGVVAGSGCVLAAAGVGAGGAIHFTDRGAESLVSASVDRTLEASRSAFRELGIAETRATSEQEGGRERRSLEGKNADRDITVELRSEPGGTRVGVVARKSAVTWDKDLAKKVLGEIVEGVK